MEQQSLATRFAKTLVYWPFEDEHAEESAGIAWAIISTCTFLGIAASFENLFLGIGLTVLCIHGSALARYLATRRSNSAPQ